MKENKNRKMAEDINEKPLMPYLPQEIITDIHSRLPARSLLKFRCVSKSWSILFNNPKLIDIIKNNFSIMVISGEDMYSIDNESLLSASLLDGINSRIKKISCPVDVVGNAWFVGCCNGLFCVRAGTKTGYCLWNPTTGAYKEMPIPSPPPQIQGDNSLYRGLRRVSAYGVVYDSSLYRSLRVSAYGFGYDRKNDEYKFVLIGKYSKSNLVAEIYSLRSDSWKRIQNIPRLLCYDDYKSQRYGVFCNGALHWQSSSSSNALFALHMTDESTREISLPKYFDNTGCIDVLDELLCMLCYNHNLGFEVWLMKDYGKKDSWTKTYSIPIPASIEMQWRLRCLRRIKRLKTGEILLEVEYGDMNEAALVLYDPMNEIHTVLKLDEDIWSSNSLSLFHTYVKSSVSLGSCTYSAR